MRQLSRLEALQPPEITIQSLIVNADMRLGRNLHPTFGHNPLAVPDSAIQIQLPQLHQVATAQPQSAASLRLAQRRKLPIHFLNPERLEQILAGEILYRRFRRTLNHLSQQKSP